MTAAIGLAALLLAGCSSPDGAAENSAAVDRSANNQAGAAPETTVRGDGSTMELSPLSQANLQAAGLDGELGCTFLGTGASPILVAMGDVASTNSSQGVVKRGGVVERVSAPGGFDAMLEDVTFAGAGTTVRIAVTGPASGGGESPPFPATLTYDGAGGAQRSVAGSWICGP